MGVQRELARGEVDRDAAEPGSVMADPVDDGDLVDADAGPGRAQGDQEAAELSRRFSEPFGRVDGFGVFRMEELERGDGAARQVGIVEGMRRAFIRA